MQACIAFLHAASGELHSNAATAQVEIISCMADFHASFGGGCREAKRSSGTLKAPHCNTKAGRKRLAVEHISLELLQQEGYFDMPIQVRWKNSEVHVSAGCKVTGCSSNCGQASSHSCVGLPCLSALVYDSHGWICIQSAQAHWAVAQHFRWGHELRFVE